VNRINAEEYRGAMLSFLTDTVLILIAIVGSLYYTKLIGMSVLGLWFLLELRRMRIRKRFRPLVVYPSIKFIWITLLAILGILGFYFGASYDFLAIEAIGFLALLNFFIFLN
jgi:hypothetical protein